MHNKKELHDVLYTDTDINTSAVAALYYEKWDIEESIRLIRRTRHSFV